MQWKDFDGQRAYAHVEKMVAFGPHPSGSEAIIKTQAYIVGELKKLGLRVDEREFTADTPRGKIAFKNILAWLGDGKDIIVLGSHYETKWFKDFEFVGANDGGSSTGALLELARVLTTSPQKPHSTICFAFFDGEEAFEEYSKTDGFYGSRHLAKEWQGDGTLKRVKALLLLDMIGDSKLTVTIPNGCASKLTLLVFQAAEELGTRKHFEPMDGDLHDDHTAFSDEGVPVVDLIDFKYGSRRHLHDYWHTAQDTLDKISPESLRIVGQVVLKALPRVDAQPRSRSRDD